MMHASQRGLSRAILLFAPFLLYLYPAVGGFLASSQVPTILGRYSVILAAFNSSSVILYVFALSGVARGSRGLLLLSYFFTIALSYLVAGNNELQQLPLIATILPTIRLLAGVCIIALEFSQYRRTHGSVNRVFLMFGVFVCCISMLDGMILLYTRSAPPHAATLTSQFRNNGVRLDRIDRDSILLIGDSFVWGAGVAPNEAFGEVLETLATSNGSKSRVYSLGIVGAGMQTYIRILSDVPQDVRSRRIILSFYMNDMPPRDRVAQRTRNLFVQLGVGAPTLRLLGDSMGKLLTPTADDYLVTVNDDWSKHDPSFAARWGMLKSDLERFAGLAADRSMSRPLLVILPTMVDFQTYPLEVAHHELSELGIELGYEVLDLLPVFRRDLVDGKQYRVTPNDNHFNAEVHALVASEIWNYLDVKE